MYITTTKARENAGMAGSRPYMWNRCVQRKGNVGWRRGSLAHANGVTTLGKSEICTWHGHPTLAQNGVSNPIWSDAIEHSLLVDFVLDPVEDMCITPNPLDVLFLVNGLLPMYTTRNLGLGDVCKTSLKT